MNNNDYFIEIGQSLIEGVAAGIDSWQAFQARQHYKVRILQAIMLLTLMALTVLVNLI